jgi:hypothetical protein
MPHQRRRHKQMSACVKRPEEHWPVRIEPTNEQQQNILDYMKTTGQQVQLALVVDVIEGKIAPAAVAVGAV